MHAADQTRDDALWDHRERARSLLRRIVALDTAALRLVGHGGPLAATQPAVALAEAGQHTWPLADDPGRDPDTLTPYERRPDDAALLAARDGAAFFVALGDPPTAARLRRAAAALASRRFRACVAPQPDVSIIVPVHGQLAHTLTCLDGLLGHFSARSLEVIVVDDASPDGSPVVLERLAAAVPGIRVLRQARNQGFVAACNAGAASASGRLLVLLNNDTRVVEGWLDALADSFARFPRAGLVGSKLLYPDGRLQECGGILWRDGTAWNFGRNQDPNDPAVCHARQTDYVSGASIAIPADLWRALGGFDAHFAPAYAEDADLAMRVRRAGFEVWVQPLSRVIHDEGATGGTDPGAGAKAYQTANLKKLFVRWYRALAAHDRPGAEPYFVRERGVRQRALVIDATTPTPAEDAGSGVTVHTIRLLQRLGYKVHFVPQDNFLFQPGLTSALQADGVECGYAPFDTGIPDYLSRHGALFDVVLVFRPGVLSAVLPDLRRHAPQAVVLFSNADLHFLRHARAAELTGDVVAAAAAAREKLAELALIEAADAALILSSHERDVLAREAPAAQVMPQAFPHRLVGTTAGFSARRDFLFLGGYGHPPNADAAAFFVREVLPLIRRRLPQARAHIAGANPTADVRALAGPDVDVLGPVAELAPLLDRVRVFVCPLRYGAGVKGKVIMAMAHGLPVVATSCGAEGAGLVDGRDLLVADGAGDFAEACSRLHRDRALWAALSQAGLEHVATACSDEAGERDLLAAIDAGWRRKLGLDPAPVPPSPAGA